MMRRDKIRVLPENFGNRPSESAGINEPIAEIHRKAQANLIKLYEGEIIPNLHQQYQKDIIPRIVRDALDRVQSLDGDEVTKDFIGQSYNYQKAREIVFGSFFRRSLEDFPLRDKIFQIARENSYGSRTAIIGGFVYSGIARALYNQIPAPRQSDKIDIDIVIEEKIGGENNRLRVPKKWRVTQTKYGVSLRRDNVNVDLNYLEGFHALQQRSNPKLEDIFPLTPLNVQAIFYDINEEKVVGDMGIEAIEKKEVRVNNSFEAQRLVDIIRKNRGEKFTLDDLVQEKAERLGFNPVL